MTDRVVRTHRPNPRERKGEIHAATREFCRYASPFSLWACVTLISLYADRWILQSIVGEREVGIYIALYQIANAPIALTVGILHQFVTPIIFDAAGDMKTAEQRLQSSDLVNISVSVCAILMALVVIVAYHFSEQLVRLLTSEDFVEWHYVLWIIVLGLSLFHVGQMLVAKGLSRNAPGSYVFPKVLQAIVTGGASFVLVRVYGLEGAAEALCGAAGAYLLAVLWVNRGLQRESQQ